MLDWWNSLELATQVFYCIAIPSTLVLIVQAILTFVGIGDGVDADVDADVDIGADADAEAVEGVFGENDAAEAPDTEGMEGLRLFTFRGIVAFFVVLGWVGVAMSASGAPLYLTIPIALVCGFAMMLSLALIFRAVMRLRSDGNTDNRNAVGTAGKVQLTIPPARSGEGKVHVMLQGAYVERNAVTDEEEAIPTGTEIIVVGVSGQTDLVVRRK